MERQIARQIARAVAMVFPLLMIASAAMAQWVVSTKAGIIQYIEGDVFLEGRRIQLPQLRSGSYLQMENGQNLRTMQGRVELLLTPSVYLRLGENGLLRLEQNKLNDIQLALEQGSALIEVMQESKGNRIRMSFSASIIEIKKAGLYRFDAGPCELRVYGGEALVARGKRKTTVKIRRMVRLENNLASSKFDVNAADSLHKWAAQRSFNLFIASRDALKQMTWTPIGAGWLRNSNYRVSFYSQVFFDQWVIDEQRAQAIAQAQALRAAQAQAIAQAQALGAAQAQAQAAAAQAQAGAGQTPTPAPQPAK